MRQRQITERIFFGFAILNIIITYVILVVSKGEFVYALTYDESNFADFWSHLNRLLYSQHIYSTDADAVFPPLAYLFLKLFAYPLTYKAEAGAELGHISQSGFGILTVVMYILLFAWLFMIAVHLLYVTDSFYKKAALAGILLFSYSVWGFAFERGNLALYTLVFLMFGLALQNSPNKVMRELSLISVAIAAGIKLYPALFGLLWLQQKRYKEAVRLIVYGLLAFFVPFLFVDSLINYIHTFRQYLDKGMYSHASLWGTVFNLFGNNKYSQFLCRVLVVLIILWVVFTLFADGINWKTVTLLMATHTLILPEQYVYTYVFIIIPLIYFLNEAGRRKFDYAYAVLFAVLFTLPPIFIGGRGRLMFWTWIALLLIVSADEAVSLIKLKRE